MWFHYIFVSYSFLVSWDILCHNALLCKSPIRNDTQLISCSTYSRYHEQVHLFALYYSSSLHFVYVHGTTVCNINNSLHTALHCAFQTSFTFRQYSFCSPQSRIPCSTCCSAIGEQKLSGRKWTKFGMHRIHCAELFCKYFLICMGPLSYSEQRLWFEHYYYYCHWLNFDTTEEQRGRVRNKTQRNITALFSLSFLPIPSPLAWIRTAVAVGSYVRV